MREGAWDRGHVRVRKTAWEQLDQDGRVIATRWLNAPPTDRGLYRARERIVELRDIFGMWRLLKTMPAHDERCIPPIAERDASADGGANPAAAAAGALEPELDTSQVRPYEAGDALRAISWRQTAHHGQLMSFEDRPQGARRAIVFVDTSGIGGTSPNGNKGSQTKGRAAHGSSREHEQAQDAAHEHRRRQMSEQAQAGALSDELARAALETVDELERAGQRPVLTDGRRTIDSRGEMLRFLAALQVGNQPALDPLLISQLLEARDRGFGGDTARIAGDIVLVTTAAESGLGTVLSKMPIAPQLRIVPVNTADSTADCAADSAAERPATGPAKGRARKARNRVNPSPSSAEVPRRLSCFRAIASCLIVFAGLCGALLLARPLLETGAWMPFGIFAYLCTATLGAMGQVVRGRRARLIILAAGFLCVLAGALGILTWQVHEVTGLWLPLDAVALQEPLHAMAPNPLIEAGAVLEQGFSQLYLGQWVPLKLKTWGDAAVTGAIAVSTLPLWMLARSRRARPYALIVPAAVMTLRRILLGIEPTVFELAALALGFVVLFALIDGPHGSKTRPVLTVLIAAVLALGLQPAVLTWARGLPVNLGFTTTLTSMGGINPFVDLRRDLVQAPETTAITYTTSARHPLYLRMSTLSNFDGNTWAYDSALPAQQTGLLGNLLGGASGSDDYISRLADSTGTPDMSESERKALATALSEQAPYGIAFLPYETGYDHLTWAFAMMRSSAGGADGGQGTGAGQSTESGTGTETGASSNATGASSGAAAIDLSPVTAIDATLTARALTSRFLPLPTGTVKLDAKEGFSAGMDWTRGEDGSAYGTTSAVSPGMSWTAESAYLTPISQVKDLNAVRQLLQKVRSIQMGRIEGGSGSAESSGYDDDGAGTAGNDGDPGSAGTFGDLYGEDAGRGIDSPEFFYDTIDARYIRRPRGLPASARRVVEQAREQGAYAAGPGAGAFNLNQEIRAVTFLLRYFTDGSWTYSYDAPDGDGQNNLEVIGDFLESKTGYCVHYATAFAVLARSIGVPSRVVLGYRANGDQTADGAYIATNKNLHAWDEVYLYGIGWIPIDVTPAASGSPTTEVAEETEQAANTDSTASDSSADQNQQTTDEQGATSDATATSGNGGTTSGFDLAGAIGLGAASVAAFAAGILGKVGPWLLGGLCAIALCGGPRLLRRILRSRRIALAGDGGRAGAEAAWRELMATAVDCGIRWREGATEEEIARAIRGAAKASGSMIGADDDVAASADAIASSGVGVIASAGAETDTSAGIAAGADADTATSTTLLGSSSSKPAQEDGSSLTCIYQAICMARYETRALDASGLLDGGALQQALNLQLKQLEATAAKVTTSHLKPRSKTQTASTRKPGGGSALQRLAAILRRAFPASLLPQNRRLLR